MDALVFFFFFFNAVSFKIHEICINSYLLYLINNVCIRPMMIALTVNMQYYFVVYFANHVRVTLHHMKYTLQTV